jgi:hypothetical protein
MYYNLQKKKDRFYKEEKDRNKKINNYNQQSINQTYDYYVEIWTINYWR